uniref:Uncharacterized protein n=1 Tax=Rhodosorus marinus TaxID=101924 RepID=A0A7S3EDK9_9RHOD|mmetsp:Transcript_24235/g.95409  ORF Transcript_24235/g.95409 Transcript_24235/m.95409 type:complete len:767 (+) Transcript_24235:116-2416(+)|eukprot:CAMPEP_0113957962 /NCGR_PEP_ID=MMETSP0011_2-20120614/3074_1 /TAXON_ID=101924 /ORGANISM="Rhodosorus marinus" /LENGTH=766 /DNA_ID=CAMNT_0000968609 /DNA_START=17 /DNA_END=2320 /DNA_ORIENTATION=- /assembly_acc=CAM_ASM_000156
MVELEASFEREGLPPHMFEEHFGLKGSVSMCSLRSADFDNVFIYFETDKEDIDPVSVHRHDESLCISNLPIRHISLDCLATICPMSLKSISLAANLLTEIDLSALSLCADLEKLCLNGNQLTSIHLEPLARCSKLEQLWLHNNRISEIDLSPLSECTSFRSLYLENNAIDTFSLDLEPLRKCKLLKSLRLSGNELNSYLDVTPLLECHTLSTFTYPATAKLVAKYRTHLHAPDLLPPAFRRRSVHVKWIEDKVNQPLRKIRSREEIRYRVALLWLRTSFGINAEALLNYDAELSVVRILQKSEFDLNQACGMDVVLVQATDLETVREVRALNPSIPIVVVGSPSDAESGGSCLRHGANLFLREPLSGVCPLVVRNLANKYRSRDERTSWMENGGAQRRGSRLAAPKKGREINFEKIRNRYLNQNLSRLGRCHLEEPALQMIFQRKGGSVKLADFQPIASICGLPASVSEAFFRSVRGWQYKDDVDEAVVGVAEFDKFWRANIQNAQIEARFFNILRRKGESRVRISALNLVLAQLQEKNLVGSNFKTELLSAVLSYTVNGKLEGYTLSEAKKAQICSSIVATEANVYSGVMQSLKNENLERIMKGFRKVSIFIDEKGTPYTTEKMMMRYGQSGCPLTSAALHAVFKTYCGHGKSRMSIGEYARLFLACEDPSTVSAMNYFFKALDSDFDGALSTGDLAPFYWEKGRQGFPTFWLCAKDMTGCEDSEISARDLCLLPPCDKAAFLRTILFRDEEIEDGVEEWVKSGA